MQNRIIYEQPLNERIRTLLRLEYLFKQGNHFLGETSVWDSRAMLLTILEIGSIFSRGDLKGELMKELERHGATLARLESNPDVDHRRLGEILNKLDSLIDRLHVMSGQFDHAIKNSEFLNSVKQRSAMPGGTCDFDLPALHYWLERPAEVRIRNLQAWFRSFAIIHEAVTLILHLTRQSSVPVNERAEGGFFQKSLDPNIPCQMVRVAVPSNLPFFPEISGGKHRFSIRFLEQPNLDTRAAQTTADVDFQLTCCII